MVEARVGERLYPAMSGARVAWVVLKRERPWECTGRRSGYTLTIIITLAREPNSLNEVYTRWLRGWVESLVASSLLELVNPMCVNDVSLLRPWDFV
jgi:hypothetical protein